MTDFIPNTGQHAAAEALFEFLLGTDREFRLTGPAGVGKTAWMKYIINVIIPRYHEMCKMLGIPIEYEAVALTGTTNKSAEALQDATGLPVSTIHSFLGLKVKDNYSTGKSTIEKTVNWRVHENLILFLDECYMADTPLLRHMKEGLHKCKIIYIGDHCQLNPVMEAVSPIMQIQSPFYELTEPMRTTVPELQAINAQLRETVETGIFKPIKIIPGIIDHLNDQQMEQEIERYFKVQTKTSRILAYTNQRVLDYNDHIRHIRSLGSTYSIGENLVNNTSIQFGDRRMSVEMEVTVTRAGKVEDVRIEEGVNMQVQSLDLLSSRGDLFTDVKVPLDREHYTALIKYFAKVGKAKGGWEKYYDLKNKYPDLRQRDAATSHKAQGSSYDVPFIDLENISSCHVADQVARMLYVTFSRARQRIFLYGQLADKYGGLIY